MGRREDFFSKRVFRRWKGPPREVVGSLSLEVFNKCLGAVTKGHGLVRKYW